LVYNSALFLASYYCSYLFHAVANLRCTVVVSRQLVLLSALSKWTISLLLSYMYGAPCKARNFDVVYIYGPTFCNAESRLFLFAAQQWINAESFPVSQLCVNTLPSTKITLITDRI
jgi:hypothetical protein